MKLFVCLYLVSSLKYNRNKRLKAQVFLTKTQRAKLLEQELNPVPGKFDIL